MKITFDSDHQVWKAAEEVSYRLAMASVYLDHEGWLVASDGFILAVVPVKIEYDGDEDNTKDILIPASVFPTWAKAATRVKPEITIHVNDGSATARTRVGKDQTEAKVSIPLTAVPFPHWRHLIPESAGQPIPYACFDPRLVTRLCAAIGLTAAGKAAIIHSSGLRGPGVIQGDSGAFGVIMPIFVEDQDIAWILNLRRERIEEP